MSEASVLTPTVSSYKGGPKLTDGQRHLIVAAVLAGESQASVAKRFGVHHNTVYTLCKSVKGAENPGEPSNWREKLTQTLPAKSVQALELSITDTTDVHKAASSAIAHLKGIGALQQEGGGQVNVFVQMVSGLPADWQRDYFGIEDHPYR